MLASFKTFRGGFGELLVEISFPRSDEVLCTTFPEDLPCAHSQKFVGMVDLVVMCLGEGTVSFGKMTLYGYVLSRYMAMTQESVTMTCVRITED